MNEHVLTHLFLPDLEGMTIKTATLHDDGFNGWLEVELTTGARFKVTPEHASLTDGPHDHLGGLALHISSIDDGDRT